VDWHLEPLLFWSLNEFGFAASLNCYRRYSSSGLEGMVHIGPLMVKLAIVRWR
jgi:hypothetical protein